MRMHALVRAARVAMVTVAVGMVGGGCGGKPVAVSGSGASASGASTSAASNSGSAANAAASANTVKNPSGAGGSTSGWTVGQASWGTLTAEQKSGQPWLHFAGSAASNAWVLYPMAALSQGSDYTCGFAVMGSGTIYADFWTGHEDVKSNPQDLSNTPATMQVTATIASNPDQGNGTPQIQLRYDAGPADVYFNDVTCVPGDSVTLVKTTGK